MDSVRDQAAEPDELEVEVDVEAAAELDDAGVALLPESEPLETLSFFGAVVPESELPAFSVDLPVALVDFEFRESFR